MESQVFYRKWRPQALAEVAGQEHVTQTLLNALSSGHISHAYLFCGPRGTGKNQHRTDSRQSRKLHGKR